MQIPAVPKPGWPEYLGAFIGTVIVKPLDGFLFATGAIFAVWLFRGWL